MKNFDFPFFKTKIESLTKKFNLNDPSERAEYFNLKAGSEIEKLREYFKENTFIAYFLGKKGSGKGTYTKLLVEIFGEDKIEHVSVGDIVRQVDKELQDQVLEQRLEDFLKQNYRGWQSLQELMTVLKERSTKVLLPTELVLTLIKREIAKKPKKTLFIDGFPREMDQISYSLFFRDLIGYRDDRDLFVLIDVPEAVINERMKWRRVCPLCQTPRNLKLLPTPKIGYDQEKKEFYLVCDSDNCRGARMLAKEGDELGIEPIRQRLETDGKLMVQTFSLYGIPKIFLRNSVPVEKAGELVDDYELTPEYSFEWQEKEGRVIVKEKPWQILDDEGRPSYSLLAPAAVMSLIKQLVQILDI